MSRIDELVQRLCPDGVEFCNIYDVCSFTRGKTITQKETKEGTIPVVAGGQKPAYYHGESNREGTTVVVAGSGAYAGYVSLWTEPIWVSDAFSVEPLDQRVITPKFIYQLLVSKQDWLYSLKKGSGVPHVHGKDLAKLRIPVPPVEVQEEIVRVLDSFAELEAELEARRAQYAHYRDRLLTFGNNVPWATLGEVGAVRMCKRIMKHQTSDSGDIPFYKIGTFGGQANAFISKELFDDYAGKYSYPKKGDILISAAGTIGRTVVFDGKPSYFQDSNIVWLEHDGTQVTNSYLSYIYQTSPWYISAGGTISRLYNDNILKAKIPVPPLGEQARIVAILDQFDTLVNDISQGLPAEIEARRKQYAYYRDKLLSFPEKKAI
ncbi:MAG: restriction endonuclease subunit S [Coriobacteriia bacterium]|nr:restriction endonuclease subunit S [Coriobacteriia bacterium]